MLRRAKAEKGRGRGPKRDAPHGLLVVSDDKDACELMARLMEREGHAVERLYEEGSVIPALHEQSRQAALISFSGGSSTNLKIVDAIRNHQDDHVRATPVVLVTLDDKNQVFSWQSGVDGYLVRPFHADELVRIMTETLARTPEERQSYRRAELKKAQHPVRQDTIET